MCIYNGINYLQKVKQCSQSTCITGEWCCSGKSRVQRIPPTYLTAHPGITATPTEQKFLPNQNVTGNTNQSNDTSSLLRPFNPDAQGHRKSCFVKWGSFLRSSWMAYNVLMTSRGVGQVSEKTTFARKHCFKTLKYRKSIRVIWPTPSSHKCTPTQRRKSFVGVFHPEFAVHIVLCTHPI